jgi:hypothetical protein
VHGHRRREQRQRAPLPREEQHPRRAGAVEHVVAARERDRGRRRAAHDGGDDACLHPVLHRPERTRIRDSASGDACRGATADDYGVAPTPFLFCLVPAERADALLEPLREHFAHDPHVAVLVERRAPGPQRPSWAPGDDHAHRRAPAAERDVIRALAPELRRQARHLRFVQRLEPVNERHQDTSTPDLVAAIRTGEPEAASELWWRVAERVQMRLRARLAQTATAPRPERGILGRILDELDDYDPYERPLLGWLDDVVDRYAAEVAAAERAAR